MAYQTSAIAEVRLQLDNMLGQFAAVLPRHITAERFGRVVLTGIQNNPELLDCDRRSLWNAAMRAANDGLLPDGRLGALVVYKDRKRNIRLVQWMPMIAGLRQKVRNSGEIASWEAHVVRERDLWEYEQGDNPHIFHKPVRGERGAVVAAYSIAKFKTGELSREWMWIEELDKVRRVSRAERGPWQDWPDEMYRKTVARRHAKVLPMSSDLDDLLRRPDEPDNDEGGHDHPLPSGSEIDRRRLSGMTDALDMIAATSASRSKAAVKQKPADLNEDDLGAGEVIDQGEYAASDDELPLDQQEDRRHGASE